MSFFIALSLSGCEQPEEENTVVIEPEEEEAPGYGLVPVTREDVILTKNLTATYTQTQQQEVSFPVGGKRVSKVHVHAGDKVESGDLLIELANSDLQEKIDELEYKIQKNNLLLGYLDKAEAFEEADAYNSFVYNTPNIQEEDVTNYEKKQDSIRQDYEYKREDYRDEIEFDSAELSELKNELKTSRIYASMSGIVYSVAENLEGSTSRKDAVVMTIVDNASGLFETSEPSFAEYFHDGETVPMDIVYGSASGEYELMPYQMESWSDKQQFTIFSAPDNDGIDVGTSGTIRVTLDERKQVLALPVSAVYYADGSPYVYTLDENNFRQMAPVSVGLVGDSRVEITGGLAEGDQVVLR